MDILEKFIRSVSYKFPKGYPDMKDPKDVEFLNKLISEVVDTKMVINEQQTQYVKHHLK